MPEMRRSVLGNKADELGAVDSGADVEGINRSVMPTGRQEPLEVNVERVEDGIQLVPVRETEAFRRALGEIEEGPLDLMMASLVEEPDDDLVRKKVNGVEIEARESRLAQVSGRSPREGLVWYGSHPEYMQAMAGDRILVRKDVLELEDACRECHGRGYDEGAVCQHCGGTRVAPGTNASVPCSGCVVLGYDSEKQWSSGRVPCARCFGSGWRAGVVIPQVAERKPITGIIVSMGPECRLYRIGDRVIHSRYAGHEMTVAKNESFVMMRECEVLSILRQRHA